MSIDDKTTLESQNLQIIMKNLFKSDDIPDDKKIVDELLNDNNLERKTELDNCDKVATIRLLSIIADSKGLKFTSIVLTTYLTWLFKYLISKKRKGREEFIAALINLKKADTNKYSNLGG